MLAFPSRISEVLPTAAVPSLPVHPEHSFLLQLPIFCQVYAGKFSQFLLVDHYRLPGSSPLGCPGATLSGCRGSKDHQIEF